MALQGWGELCVTMPSSPGLAQCSQRPGSDGIRWLEPAGSGRAVSVQISWIISGQTHRPGKPSQIQLADWVSEER